MPVRANSRQGIVIGVDAVTASDAVARAADTVPRDELQGVLAALVAPVVEPSGCVRIR